jgi:hypothetical protein
MTDKEAAREIGRLACEIIKLAPVAGLYVGIKIEPAKPVSTPPQTGGSPSSSLKGACHV